jgi:hypothetical protein
MASSIQYEELPIAMKTELGLELKHPLVVYQHDPRNEDYSESSYRTLKTIQTGKDMGETRDAIDSMMWQSNNIYIAKPGTSVRYEVPPACNGKVISNKVPPEHVQSIMMDLMIHMACGTVFQTPANNERVLVLTSAAKGQTKDNRVIDQVIKIWMAGKEDPIADLNPDLAFKRTWNGCSLQWRDHPPPGGVPRFPHVSEGSRRGGYAFASSK